MTERPILFNGPMVRAILSGAKTQTRRILKPWPKLNVGDTLWCRETWAHDAPNLDTCRRGVESDGPSHGPYYKATATQFDIASLRWRPSIHMPRWASRITLAVTGVRIERLQSITEEDAMAEGAPSCGMDDDGIFYEGGNHRIGFAGLWDHINGSGAWDANPWVAVIQFDKVKP